MRDRVEEGLNDKKDPAMSSVGTAFQNKGTAHMKALHGRRMWHVWGTNIRQIRSVMSKSGLWHKVGSERRAWGQVTQSLVGPGRELRFCECEGGH